MTDDVVIVQPWPYMQLPAPFPDESSDTPELPTHEIDLEFLSIALAQTIAQGGYLYEAKLYVRRVTQLEVEIPITASGRPDIARQRQIAAVAKRLDDVRARVDEMSRWMRQTRLA